MCSASIYTVACRVTESLYYHYYHYDRTLMSISPHNNYHGSITIETVQLVNNYVIVFPSSDCFTWFASLYTRDWTALCTYSIEVPIIQFALWVLGSFLLPAPAPCPASWVAVSAGAWAGSTVGSTAAIRTGRGADGVAILVHVYYALWGGEQCTLCMSLYNQLMYGAWESEIEYSWKWKWGVFMSQKKVYYSICEHFLSNEICWCCYSNWEPWRWPTTCPVAHPPYGSH